MRTRKIIVCSRCGDERRHEGRGLCPSCYRWARTNNALDNFARAIESRLVAPGDWIEDALCAQVDTDIFFPDKGGSLRPARAVCRRCEVKADCLDFAIANDEQHGIWGGLSFPERHALKVVAA